MTGEALTHSSLLEADGAASMVTMTTVEPVNLHHVMLRAQGMQHSSRYSLPLSDHIIYNYYIAVLPLCTAGPTDPIVVLSPPHDLVNMTAGAHSYGEDVVALL